ncbi:MAG: hypothetical protein A2Z20_07655 [Bdellovibrionales bacterium RBG_16_40_8]|nr:MAG: hypothetical protein A2Z20_07655 [Bdellovibrionales bacterium RBG_16_40_8]
MLKLLRATSFTYVLILSFLLSFLPNASADDHHTISLREIIKTGLKNSPRIKKSTADLLSTQAQTRKAIGALFPQINIKSIATQHDDEYYRAYIDATQPLYAGGAISAAISLYRNNESAARISLINETQKVIYDIILSYFNVTQQTKLVEAAAENTETMRKHATVIRGYEKIGRARRTDRLQTQVNLLSAQAEVQDLKTQLFTERENLRELLALEESPLIQIENEIKFSPFEITDPSKAVKEALTSNPEIQLTELVKNTINDEKDIALAADKPNLALRGQIGYRNIDRNIWFDQDSKYSSASLELTIPIFSGLSSIAKKRDFAEKKNSAARNLEIKKNSLESRLRTKFNDLSTISERLEIARQATLDSKEALELANRDYQRSTISSQDVLNIQRTRYDAKKLYIRTQYTYMRLLLDIRQYLGQNLENIYAK